jgi:hypothetical protein
MLRCANGGPCQQRALARRRHGPRRCIWDAGRLPRRFRCCLVGSWWMYKVVGAQRALILDGEADLRGFDMDAKVSWSL